MPKLRKPAAWPLLVKQGSVTVKVFNTPENGKDRYTVEWYEGGLRKRFTRVDLAEARHEAKTTAERLDAGRGAALHLTGKDRDAYVYAVAKLRSLSLPLNVAIDEFIEAKKVGVPLLTAAKYYQLHNHAKLPSKTVTEIVSEFLQAKKTDGRSVRYLQDCKARLERFSRDFQTELKAVQTSHLDAWLRGLKLSPRSRNNFRTVISSLFSFAKASGYLPKDRPTEAEATTVANGSQGEIQVFTPDEFSKLLTLADVHLLPFLVFGGFCGLRSAEIMRLRWEDVNWQEKVVEIRGAVAKTGTRRLAPIPDAGKEWLAGYLSQKGPVIGKIKLYERLENLSEQAGVTWKPNALRHSFGTYRMAVLKNPIQVAYEMGNSPGIVRQHYDRVVTESKGKLWFSLLPRSAGNVISIEAA